MNSKNIGLYIHIPFCRSKCPYCDFFSMRGKGNDYREYVSILKNRIHYWSEKTNRKVDTVYFGGGTPTAIGTELLCELLASLKNNFDISDNAEITIEANPINGDSFDFNKVKEYGVNRVSIGMQSSDDAELKLLGRLHSPLHIAETVNKIKASGINNISLDLMLGIPNQTKETLRKSIDFCAELGVNHISSYILKIEEGTVFDKRRASYNFPDDDATAELYLFAVKYLAGKGFKQYEISNFCRSGFESRHNLKYWLLDDYLGIGPAAHSCIDGKRFYYNRSIDDFKNNIIVDEGVGCTEEEYIMLRLRLTEGLNVKKYKKTFGKEMSESFFMKADKFCRIGLMRKTDDSYSLTPNGFLLSNTIISELI